MQRERLSADLTDDGVDFLSTAAGDQDAFCTNPVEYKNNRPGGTAGSDHKCRFAGGIETGIFQGIHKADGVGVVALERPPSPNDGVDGSDDSYHALEIAIELAKAFDTTVRAVAVYDPFFHIGVFRKIAEVLSPKDQKKFNFTAQEAIHDEIIDKGLEKLYKEGLDRGNLIAESKKVKYESEVLLGKALSKINHYAAAYEAGLIVLGRWGRHKEHISLIGSNSIKCARLSNSNILITTPPETPLDLPNLPKTEKADEIKEIKWTPEAMKVLERIPKFVRNMAKKSIENRAREKNMDKVDDDLINEVAKKMGMR